MSTPGFAAGFQGLHDEAEVAELPVKGALPGWLEGSLLRNGPARYDAGERSLRHWFDGQAMLHRFTFDGGRVSYANRFLDTAAHPRRRVGDDRLPRVRDRPVPLTVRPLLHPLLAQAHPERERQHHPLRRPLRGADRDADTGRLRPGHARDRGSGRLRGRVERPADDGPPAPGPHDRRPGQLPAALLAHQRVPPLPAEGHGRGPRADRQPPDRPPLLHAQLRDHAPVRGPRGVPARGEPAEHRAQRPAVHRELPLGAGARHPLHGHGPARRPVRGVYEGPAFFAFHHINAFDDGDDVVLDICSHEDASVIDTLYLDRLRAGDAIPFALPTRYRIGLGTGDVERAAAVRGVTGAAAHRLRAAQRRRLPLRVRRGRPRPQR